MFISKSSSKRKGVKKSEIWRIWFTKNRVTILAIVTRFLCPEPLSILPSKTWHGCQIVARFYSIRSRLSFSKSAFFTISRVKFKPLIGFWCRFRLYAPDTWPYLNVPKNSSSHHSKIDFQNLT